MDIRKKISDIRKKHFGYYQFIIRSSIFFGIVLAVYLAIFLWIRHMPFFLRLFKIDDTFYLPWLSGLRKTDFLNAGAFAVIAFIIWNRGFIHKLKAFQRNWTETFILTTLALMSFAGHYYLKYWIGTHLETASQAIGFFIFLKYLLNALFIIFTALACYTLPLVGHFIREKWKSIVTFLVLGGLYFFLIQLFQKVWYNLSYFVARTIYHMLSWGYDRVYFSPGNLTSGPRLGVNGFIVGISDACSGIDSLLLFISLYTLIFVLDWKRLDRKRMWLLLIPGLLGTVAYNILRIYALLLVGLYISPEFAVDMFHTNAGWILFLLFFLEFWHFGSKWVYHKGKQKRSG